MLKAGLFALAILTTSLVHATVNVNVGQSEGLFVCNAGIQRLNQGNQCFVPGTIQACQEGDAQCVCYRGTQLSDYAEVRYEDLLVDENSGARFRTTSVRPQSGEQVSQLFNNEDLWFKRIKELSFSMNSEVYGTRYFVDFCYQGPIAKVKPGKGNGQNREDETWGIYELNTVLSVAQLDSRAVSYREAAGLRSHIQVVCDLRERGQSRNARGSNELSPGAATPELDLSLTVGPALFQTNSQQLSTLLNSDFKQVPRFCKLRVTLTETVSSPRLNGNSAQEATIDLYIDKQTAF